jgi:DNA recombination protein RmuC
MNTLLVILAMTAFVGILAVFWEIRKLRKARDSNLGENQEVLMRWLEDMRNSQQQSTTDISDQMQKQNERLDKAATAIGRVLKMGESTEELVKAFRAPKYRGTSGEVIMKDVLAQVLPKQNFSMPYSFKSGEAVDAVIRTNAGLIPVDAKFPLDNYLAAEKTKGPDRAAHLKDFHKRVRKHIDDIARKYILPTEQTLNFALMYVPTEAIYHEIITTTDLIRHGESKNIYAVSPNTFHNFLSVVLVSLRHEKINDQAQKVIRSLQAIQHDSTKLGTDLGVLNRHVTNAKNMMASVDKSHSRLDSKIEQASDLPAGQREKVERQLKGLADLPDEPVSSEITTKK